MMLANDFIIDKQTLSSIDILLKLSISMIENEIVCLLEKA